MLNENFEPLLIAFCCQYCSYSAADLAGSMRLQYPPNVRIVRTPCTGRLEVEFFMKAFEKVPMDPRRGLPGRRLPFHRGQSSGQGQGRLYPEIPFRERVGRGADPHDQHLGGAGQALCRLRQ